MTARRARRTAWLAITFAAVLAVAAAPAGAAAGPRKLFIAGDSTAATYTASDKNQQGWGAVLQPFFDPAKLQVVNAARGGRSSRTFITEGHWEKMLADVRKGDFVIIQFGHNDSGALNQEPPGSTRPLRARGTIPGIGNESEEIDNVVTGKHETVYSFGWYLRKMIADTRAKGATPILMSLTERNAWADGRIECPSKTYRLWDWQTAQNGNVAFVDLTRISADRYQRDGAEAVTAQGIHDTGHPKVAGAEKNAAAAVSALKTLRGMPFRKMLSERGRAVPADKGPSKDAVCPALQG